MTPFRASEVLLSNIGQQTYSISFDAIDELGRLIEGEGKVAFGPRRGSMQAKLENVTSILHRRINSGFLSSREEYDTPGFFDALERKILAHISRIDVDADLEFRAHLGGYLNYVNEGPFFQKLDKMYLTMLQHSNPSNSIFAERNRRYGFQTFDDTILAKFRDGAMRENVPGVRDFMRLIYSPVPSKYYVDAANAFAKVWPNLTMHKDEVLIKGIVESTPVDSIFANLRKDKRFLDGADKVFNGIIENWLQIDNWSGDAKQDLDLVRFRDERLEEYKSRFHGSLKKVDNIRRAYPEFFFWFWNQFLDKDPTNNDPLREACMGLTRIKCYEALSDWLVEYGTYLDFKYGFHEIVMESDYRYDALTVSTESARCYENLISNERNLTCVLGPRGVQKKVALFYETDPYVGVLRLLPGTSDGQFSDCEAVGFASVFQVYNKDEELCWLVDGVDAGLIAVLFGSWRRAYYDGIIEAARDCPADKRPAKIYFNDFVANRNNRQFNECVQILTESSPVIRDLRKRGGNQALRDAGFDRPEHFIEAFQYREDGSVGTMWLKDNPDGSPKTYKARVYEVDLHAA